MARQLKPEAEVGVLRAFSKFSKIFNTQLPLTKGHLAHFVLGPVSTCVREREVEMEGLEKAERVRGPGLVDVEGSRLMS